MKYISNEQLSIIVQKYGKSEYRNYLKELLKV